ncbi:MAG TPA: radical SAM protein [Firmicutes bacterium]|nr:radical SAM protein [Bacillota bacterium]
MSLFDLFRKKVPGVKPGLHEYIGTGDLAGYKFHLRVENDGSGILIVNASRIIHCNETAVYYIYSMFHGDQEEDVVKFVKKDFRGVSKDDIINDYRRICDVIKSFSNSEDVCPVAYFNMEMIEPFSKDLTAPYRMDLALTYKCQNKCVHCYSSSPKESSELTTADWILIIEKLWKAGIPHIVFTGGEATLRPDLPELIQAAEEFGAITGLLTNGRRLSDKEYLSRLIGAGLDHIQITLESHVEAVHDKMVNTTGAFKETLQGLKNAIETPIYTITNTTLTKNNALDFPQTLEFLKGLGIETFACNGIIYAGKGPSSGLGIPEDELEPILTRIKDKALDLDMRFMWYTPTRYCHFNPVNEGLGVKRCTAGMFNMCIEPDGKVLPCQSYYKSVGNILDDDWEKIWNDPTLLSIRKRDWVDERCLDCADFDLCGGGCPLYKENSEMYCDNVRGDG